MAATKNKAPPSKASQRSKSQSKPSGVVKKKSSKPAPKPTQQKTKSSSLPAKKKKRVYTDKELGIPQLNGIRPTGIQKQPNMKKGKNFVDDREGMNAILALVLAEKEGNIESKMMRARQLEEVREAKKLELEKRAASKKQNLEDRKQDIKQSKKRSRKSEADAVQAPTSEREGIKKTRKRVSFG